MRFGDGVWGCSGWFGDCFDWDGDWVIVVGDGEVFLVCSCGLGRWVLWG